jgi:hypothetical protein
MFGRNGSSYILRVEEQSQEADSEESYIRHFLPYSSTLMMEAL